MKIEKGQTGIKKSGLLSQLKTIIENSHRENTKLTYLNALNKFQNFLTRNKINTTSEIEQNTITVLLFLTEQSNTKSFNTLKTYFAGLKSYFTKYSIPVDYPKIKTFFKGLRNEKSAASGAMALEFSELKKIVDGIDCSKLIGKRDKALLLLGFYGAFRRSELVNLDLSDITRTSKGLNILIRNSKTDKNKIGMFKAIPFTFNEYCPVTALYDYLNSANILDGAVFRSISKGDEVRGRLSDIDIYRIIKKYAPNFSAHSLRVGFITTASENGANPQSIMLQSGHKTVQMIAHYTRSKSVWKGNAVETIK